MAKAKSIITTAKSEPTFEASPAEKKESALAVLDKQQADTGYAEIPNLVAGPDTGIVRVTNNKNPNIPKLSGRFLEERNRDWRMVRGVFQDNEKRGGHIQFPFLKWPGDPQVEYRLEDGKEYELPMGVVRHLNSGCAYEEYGYALDQSGRPLPTGKKTHRFSFKVTEYN